MLTPAPKRFAAALVTLIAAPLAACGGGDSVPGGVDGTDDGPRILRVAYLREIDVLNALTSQNLVDIQFSMVEGLITTDANNNYIPVLAKEIPTEENGLVVHNGDGSVSMTWPLQAGVRWHDGEPFTSADVCFTWSFVTGEGSQVYNRDQYLGIVDCTTPNDTTAVMRWDGIYAYYGGLFEAVLPEHILGDKTTDEIVNFEPYNRGSATIGTGPFTFAEWRPGEYIRVVRNNDYWRGSEYPGFDEIVYSFIPDSNTRLNALLARDHHWGQVDATQVSEVADLEGFRVNLVSSNTFMHFDLSLNTENSRVLFADRAVRQALFHAIDRVAIVEQLMEGTVQIAHTAINPTSPYHNADVPEYNFDPQRSRELLDAAGWVVGPDGIRSKDGRRFSFQMLNRAGSTDRIAIAQVIQAQLLDVGVAVTFETLESATWTQKWRSEEWEGIISAWFRPADPSLTGLYACDGPNNMTKFCHPELDEVLEESDRHLSFEQRKPVLDEAQRLLAETAVTLPIFYNVVPEVVSEQVQGYLGSGTNFGSFWNLWEWSLERGDG